MGWSELEIHCAARGLLEVGVEISALVPVALAQVAAALDDTRASLPGYDRQQVSLILENRISG